MALPDYYPNYDQSKRTVVKVGVIIAVIITLVIICYAVFAFFFRMGKVKVEVIYAPHYAEVELNGKKVKNPSKHYLKPGEYEVKVWAPEFEEFSTKVQVDENTKYIYGSLNPATAKGQELSNDTLLDQFLEIEGITGQVLAEEGERTLEKYPILSKLPYDNSLFKLGYMINSGNKDYTLTIDTEAYIDAAVAKLQAFAIETGKELAEYKIEIKNFENNLQNKAIKNKEQNPQIFLKTAFMNVENLAIYPGEQQDDYYYTIMVYGAAPRILGTTYRTILKKNGDSWQLMEVPMPVVTTENVPGVPVEILNQLNEMTPSNGNQVECTSNCE